jgi:hypothetical protein
MAVSLALHCSDVVLFPNTMIRANANGRHQICVKIVAAAFRFRFLTSSLNACDAPQPPSPF